MRKLFIDATRIKSFGGLRVISDLLSTKISGNDVSVFLTDSQKFSNEMPYKKYDFVKIRSNFLSYIYLNFKFLSLVKKEDRFLTINNIPPLVRLNCKTYCLIHNIHILKTPANLNFFQFLRLKLLRSLLKIFKKNVDIFVVQSETMKRLLQSKLKIEKNIDNICVFPFIDKKQYETNYSLSSPKKWDFIYIADLSNHKNHKNLFEAWKILSEDGIYPTLCITIDIANEKYLNNLDSFINKYSLKISNAGSLTFSQVNDHYRSSHALIFPSFSESFGLPLVEASIMNIPILASELDYVWDICEPSATFDPNSPLSIARCVKRFIIKEQSTQQLHSPEQFLNMLLK